MDDFSALINAYKANPDSVYNTWFINNDVRLKAFRSIRRGVQQVVEDIKADRFGIEFKGSSLEFVLNVITEQKQIFRGAAHPFFWKPKLRIPDIYESPSNKGAFGQFLDACLRASDAETVLREMHQLVDMKIKGVGPAVASIIYFLHPTVISPFNTAIVKGFNRLYPNKAKLGSWESYFSMRESIVETNRKYRTALSNDLGAFAGLLFEVGSSLLGEDLPAPLSHAETAQVAKEAGRRHREVESDVAEENLHTQMQYHLVKIGTSLGYDVAVAANDRSKSFGDTKFSFVCLPTLPPMAIPPDTAATIGMIDVLWLEKGSNRVVSAFEVEKSTSIYSGILRLTDLFLSAPQDFQTLYLVVPDKREQEVVFQLTRPALKSAAANIKYILFSALREHCDAICRFGADHGVMTKLAKDVIERQAS